MIRAGYRHRAECWELRLSGHAGAAPYGQDLVCAAVTALVCALASYVSAQELKEPPVLRLEPGDARIIARGAHLAPAFETVISGLRLLAREYPENVAVEEMWDQG